jgi:hypothetical protein
MALRIIVIIALVSLFSSMGQSQWIQSAGFSGYCYSFTASDTALFAATTSGVYRSTDNGVNWVIADTGMTDWTECLMTSESSVFAGTEGYGVFSTINNGLNWNPHKIVDSIIPDINIIVSIVKMDTNIFVSTDQGVFRSSENDTIWSSANSGLPPARIWSFAVLGDKLFAVTGGSGVFCSTNKGMSWMAVNNGLTNLNMRSIAVMNTNLFVGTYQNGNVFLSTDSEITWKESSVGMVDTFVFAFAIYGSNLFAGTDQGVYLSTNSGASWTAVDSNLPKLTPTIPAYVYSLAVSGNNLVAGTEEEGIWRRPLSEMIGSSSVVFGPQQSQTLTIYPNPTSHEVTISFLSDVSSPVNVSIYNLLGNEVTQLYDGTMDAGNHSLTWDASGATSGAYMCVVRMNGQVLRVPVAVAK